MSKELLSDPSQVVRATAVHGVARIAGVYWELIPAHTVKDLISKLVSVSTTVRSRNLKDSE